ncbi:hypothetical protein D3C86_1463830 [compost metagenome]
MAPDHLAPRQALDPCSDDVFLGQLFEHEAAGHAADVGDRVQAEDQRGQDDVPERAGKGLPVTRQCRVDQQQARDVRHHAVVGQVDPPCPTGPTQPGVEHQQAHHADPENRRGVTEQGDHPCHMVAQAALVAGGDHTQRQADEDAEQDRQGGQFDGRREHPLDVFKHRVAGQQRVAEITVQQVVEVQAELGPDRFVQAHGPVHLVVGGAVGVRADHGQHRVQRHHPTNEESQRQQTQQGHQYGAGPAGSARHAGTQHRGSRKKHIRLLKKRSPITEA